jgi:hypothetical protein
MSQRRLLRLHAKLARVENGHGRFTALEVIERITRIARRVGRRYSGLRAVVERWE